MTDKLEATNSTEAPEEFQFSDEPQEVPVKKTESAPKPAEPEPKAAAKPKTTKPKAAASVQPKTVTFKVKIGTLQFEDGTFQKGQTFTVSKDRASHFDSKDVTPI